MDHRIIVLKGTPRTKHRVRSIRDSWERTAMACLADGKIRAVHGGSVANSYGYPATTSGMLAVPVTVNGIRYVGCYFCVLPANKVTLVGVARHTLPSAASLFHRGMNWTGEAYQHILEDAREDVIAHLDQTLVGGHT